MDRESYEAGFRAAQQQSAQEQPQSGGSFLDSFGKAAAGIGIAAGAGLAGRRLMRGRGNVRPTSKPQQGVVDIDATPTGSQRDRVERNARTAVNELSKRQGSLVTGAKLPPATEVSKGNFPVQNAYKQDLAARGTQPSETSNLGTTAETPGQSPRTIAPDPWAASEGGPVGKTAIADQPTTQDRRLALPPAEDPYKAAGRIDPQDFASAQVQEARRKQATQDLLAAQQARTGTFQPEIPGIKGDLMAIRNKEGFDPQVTGEVVPAGPSRPLSAAPDQQSIDFSKSYLQDKGYVDTPDVGARLKEQGLGMAGMPGDGPLEIDDGTRRYPLGSQNADIALKKAGVTSEQAESYWTSKLKSQGLLDDAGTSTETQAARRPLVVEQSVEASDTAVDQMAGRIDRNVQRDIDVDLNEFQRVDSAATDRGVNPVAAAESAAKAVDSDFAGTQTDRSLSESSAARFLANERDEIASQIAEQGLLVTPGRIEKELGNRLGSEAYKYGPEYTQLKQNIQLGATYDPELFDNPSKPFVRIAGEEVPTGRVQATKTERTPYTNTLIEEDVELGLRQPTYMKETAERLQEKAANKRDWLGSVRLEEASKNAKRNAELINVNRQYNETLDYSRELTDFLDSKQGTPEQRTRARQRLDDVNYELDRLDARSDELNQSVYGGQSGARVRGAEKFTEDYIAGLTPPSRLRPGVEEGQRLFFEIDKLSGEPIPGTQELRAERKMVDMEPKGGGGRNVAEFTAGSRDDGVEVDLESILREARTPRSQYARSYERDQFGYRPGTGLTGKALEGERFTDDRTQTGRVITRTGIQKSEPQPGSIKATVNPYTQLDDETLGMMSLKGSEGDAVNAADVLARRRSQGYDSSAITGPGQSQRVVSSVSLTPEQKQTKLNSMDVSRKIAALQRSGRPDAQQQVQKYIQQLRGGI